MTDAYSPQELPVLARYGPRTALALQRSQYLARALQQMQQSGQEIKGGWGELAARLLGTYFQTKAFNKANTALAGAMQSDQSEAEAPILGMLGNLPGNPSPPPVPSPRPPQAQPAVPTPPTMPAPPTVATPPTPPQGPTLTPQQIAMAESRNNPQAVSPVGAMGRMQVMPGTAAAPGFGIQPAQNNSDAELTRVGTDYLNAMLQRYGGDPVKAAVAYNWGPGHADHWIAGGGDLRALPHETLGYLQRLGLLGGGQEATMQPAAMTANPAAATVPPEAAPPVPPAAPAMPQPQAPQASAWGPTPQERALVQTYLQSPNYAIHQQGLMMAQKLVEKYSAPPAYQQHIDPGTGQVMYAPTDPRAGQPFVANIPGYRAPLPAGQSYEANPSPAHPIPGTQYQDVPAGAGLIAQRAPNNQLSVQKNPALGEVPPGMALSAGGGMVQIPGALPIDKKLELTKSFMGSKEYTDYQEASVALNALKALAAQKSGPATFAAFDNFVRGSNPGGIARPQMLDMAQELFGKQSQVYTAVQSWVSNKGATLPQPILGAMVDAMSSMAAARYGALKPQIDAYTYTAKRAGIDPQEIMPNVAVPEGAGSALQSAQGHPAGWSAQLAPAQLQAAKGFAGSRGAHGSRENPLVPRNAAEFNAIHSGSWYIDTDGAVVQKGAR